MLMEELYKKNFYPSEKRFYEILKVNGIKRTHKEVKDFINIQAVNQIHKPILNFVDKQKLISSIGPEKSFPTSKSLIVSCVNVLVVVFSEETTL